MKKEVFDTIDSKLLKSFEIIKKVGQGAYGQVWKAKKKKTGSTCALKKIYDAFKSPSEAQKTYRQIKYLQKLQHPNIVKLYSFYRSSNDKEIYIELQFMEADLCLALRNSVLKAIHKHYIFYQLANAIKYLHSAELIHRDIKPTNILVNQTCEAKLCDFGLIRSLARDIPGEKIVMTQNVATRWYRAPQILLSSNSYGKPVDVWSIGCVLAEMIMEKPIFQGSSTISQLQKIFEVTGVPSEADLQFLQKEGAFKAIKGIEVKEKKSIKNILNTDDANLIDLLEQIFQINPMKRPTAEMVLAHPFVAKFRGKLQQKVSSFPIKILYKSKTLSPEDYKNLLYCELEEKDSGLKGKHQDSLTFQEVPNAIYKTMPQMSRKNFMGLLPQEKGDAKSPMHVSYFNQKRFSPFGTKKDVSPIRDDKSPSEKRSPSFLLNKKKHENATPEKVQNENKQSKNADGSKHTLKRMLTFPLRISPGRNKSQKKKADEKSFQKMALVVQERQTEKQKKGNELSIDCQLKGKSKFTGLLYQLRSGSPEKELNINIFSSVGIPRGPQSNLQKKTSLTTLEETSSKQFPKNPSPPKALLLKDRRKINPCPIECPELSKPIQIIRKSPISKGLTFKSPGRTVSPISAPLKLASPPSPSNLIFAKK